MVIPIMIIFRVLRKNYLFNRNYRTEDHSLRKGDAVLVPSPIAGIEVAGEILTVEHHMKFSVPTPIEGIQVILKKIDPA